MKSACRSSEALLERLGIDPSTCDMKPDFPTLVPSSYIERMQYGDSNDPLLRQVLARVEEHIEAPGYVVDPLAEISRNTNLITTERAAQGLLQKYHGRALLITTGACAVHCRYCFRRHFPYTQERAIEPQASLAPIKADPSITEVILSGGDPLMLTDVHLQRLIDQINNIEHVQRIRLHTRLPVVLPARITAGLLDLIQTSLKPVVLVTHFNHCNELNADTRRALACLDAVCAQLLNQTVLLRGVNDSPEAQVALATRLFEQCVLPYYLHLPDKVAGTAHFDLSTQRALAIYQHMQATLPGYLVPKLVREEPGAPAKVLVSA